MAYNAGMEFVAIAVVMSILVNGFFEAINRLGRSHVDTTATYTVAASMYSVYIDVPILGLPNVSQIMSDVRRGEG
jgi:hypothetical protein